MMERLRSLLGGSHEPAEGTPHLGEAVAAWALGTAWALCCLWLWRIGPGQLVPVALFGALLTLWGWRSVKWLHWFPPVAIVASLLDLVAPMQDHASAGLGYVELIAFAAVLLALARLLAIGRVPIAGRPGEVSATLLGALGLALALAASGTHPRELVTGLVAFGAALAMAARPTGERRVWVAFPLTALLIGLQTLAAASDGLATMLGQSHGADLQWGVPHALAQLLLLALPVTLGLAIDGGPSLRFVARLAAAVGLLAVVMLLAGEHGLGRVPGLGALAAAPARNIAVATLVFLGLAVGRLGMSGGIARPRWVGLAVSLVAAATLLVTGRLLASGTAQVLLAFGVALASAVRTAERRAKALGLSPADWPLPPVVHTAPVAPDAADTAPRVIPITAPAPTLAAAAGTTETETPEPVEEVA